MNKNYSHVRRSVKLDQMIKNAIQAKPDNFRGKKNEIIDYIMANPDLKITYDQIVFLLRTSSPFVSPARKDYFDVLERLISEAKAIGNSMLVKSIYLSLPFRSPYQEDQKIFELYQGGIRYFLTIGSYQSAGELYAHLAAVCDNIAERTIFCDKALKYLDRSSKEYACVSAMREMLYYMEDQKVEKCYHYRAFGETVFQKDKSIFLSPTFSCFGFYRKEDALCFDIPILKGNEQSYEALTSLDFSGCDKEIVDETLPVGESKITFKDHELVKYPDEKVICEADGKEYLCKVFSIRRIKTDEVIMGDIVETDYYADGIGPIRTVVSIDGKNFVFNLCKYTVKGGKGMIPCYVGNQWCYRQEDCPDAICQVIKREIIAQNEDEYLLSGWNCCCEKTV